MTRRLPELCGIAPLFGHKCSVDLLRWSCKPGHEWYNSGESGLKKEIPVRIFRRDCASKRILFIILTRGTGFAQIRPFGRMGWDFIAA
jgi:hypothetical protein